MGGIMKIDHNEMMMLMLQQVLRYSRWHKVHQQEWMREVGE